MKREKRKRAYEKTGGQKDKALNQRGREKERKKEKAEEKSSVYAYAVDQRCLPASP